MRVCNKLKNISSSLILLVSVWAIVTIALKSTIKQYHTTKKASRMKI